jgi:hypothetical protein
MTEMRWFYFKDQDPKWPLISGVPLPKDADGVVRAKHFIGCTFHPNCSSVPFENCAFTECHFMSADRPGERTGNNQYEF